MIYARARYHFVFILFCWSFAGCTKPPRTLLEELSPGETNINFENRVIQGGENNVLNYTYYFNGGGVAVGDLNNDGLPDVYFSGNQVSNKLYLNKGGLQFEDITDKAGVGATQGWKTGVTLADVNLDGWLDIYVCRSAMSDSTLRQNLLFINNHDLTFSEKAKEFGVNDNSYSSHAAFFDYDRDGDLDLFVLNHSLPRYAGLTNVVVNRKQPGGKFGSKLYRNDQGKFTDVSAKAGIINNVLSFGLGIAVSDLNLDGWPDLYISNDFNEEDYFYLNQRDGTFRNVVKDVTGHVSLFSMGSDVADINNDGLPDFITLDMLPESNRRIKLSSGDDNYDKYQILIDGGFHHQTMRNMLQLNNGDGTFSEIGQLAGISNTDWSWAPLWVDFDGDGWKDLYISNGYEKDFTNMQFLKFTVDEQLKSRMTGVAPDVKMILEKMPSIDEGNYFFHNKGNLTFDAVTAAWGINRNFKSNGAAYADLDNDGDPDLVVNVMNQPSLVYRNNSSELNKAIYLKIDLLKQNPKRDVQGTKVLTYSGSQLQYEEYSPVRGFQSCMAVPLMVGTAGRETVDSVRVIWPDSKSQLFTAVSCHMTLVPRYEDASANFAFPVKPEPLFVPTTAVNWTHTPPPVNDFKKQFLIPRMYSTTGPKMVSGDVNLDGLDDVFICGPRGQSGALFLQQPGGLFQLSNTPAFESDKLSQDEDAVFFDADRDGDIDLYVVSGGYGFNQGDPLLQDRLYINDGRGAFTKSLQGLPAESLAGSCVSVLDIDGDLDPDLFVGSRMVPGQYPLAEQSFFLINDGKAHFERPVKPVSAELKEMICDALVADLNRDGKPDLVVAGEWTRIIVLINQGGTFSDETQKWIPFPARGWWNCLASDDFDHDGDPDLIVGNYGTNNQFNASAEHPATLTYKDFNSDGQIDPFFSYFINGTSYPFASRDEALGQVSFLKSRFPDYLSYADATLETMFTPDELKGSDKLTADLLKTVYLENKGNHFEPVELPIEAQFAPVYSVAIFDVDRDGDPDVVMGGNETLVRARIGKLDANKGSVFLNDGKGRFTYLPQFKSGLDLRGDVRQILFISSKEHTTLVAGEIGKRITSYELQRTIRNPKPPL